MAMEMGNLLEDLVARIFAKKTGLRIFNRERSCTRTHAIPGCWRIWTIWWNSRTARLRS